MENVTGNRALTMKKPLLILLGSVLFSGTLCAQDDVAEFRDLFQPPLKPVWDQPRSAVDEAKVQLGKALYFDHRISQEKNISCNSCHDLNKFGVDGEGFSIGFEGHRVGRNSPTVYNAFGHITQFWDGRASTVEEQAKGPILAAGEMAMPSSDAVVNVLKSIDGYGPLFKAAYPEAKDPITYDHVGDSIGAFERLLVTPGRFDRWVGGKDDILKPEEKKGLKLFVTKGSAICYTGSLLGGSQYQKVGLVKPWPNQKDQGRFAITGNEEDKMKFKVPSLRNIAKTGPFFHDASAKSLDKAVRMMGEHQLGMELKDGEVKSLVTFLKALTGRIPKDIVQPPTLPGMAKANTAPAAFE